MQQNAGRTLKFHGCIIDGNGLESIATSPDPDILCTDGSPRERRHTTPRKPAEPALADNFLPPVHNERIANWNSRFKMSGMSPVRTNLYPTPSPMKLHIFVSDNSA
jgi:hypothetical protein